MVTSSCATSLGVPTYGQIRCGPFLLSRWLALCNRKVTPGYYLDATCLPSAGCTPSKLLGRGNGDLLRVFVMSIVYAIYPRFCSSPRYCPYVSAGSRGAYPLPRPPESCPITVETRFDEHGSGFFIPASIQTNRCSLGR